MAHALPAYFLSGTLWVPGNPFQRGVTDPSLGPSFPLNAQTQGLG